jgi:hypothetical protein
LISILRPPSVLQFIKHALVPSKILLYLERKLFLIQIQNNSGRYYTAISLFILAGRETVSVARGSGLVTGLIKNGNLWLKLEGMK